ncbi:hypothetical protein RCL_jg20514.t1 [Rhizophagus clarus]|uniref:Uncharacterized protein n=1 Tax=Rhizophagus clarus TaxID=94130 RepID=A0A8H3QVL7_9GLOM|nr:hypothetical protein RCL_jg20514.t1 [Rhizophagus clarus]
MKRCYVLLCLCDDIVSIKFLCTSHDYHEYIETWDITLNFVQTDSHVDKGIQRIIVSYDLKRECVIG